MLLWGWQVPSCRVSGRMGTEVTGDIAVLSLKAGHLVEFLCHSLEVEFPL